MPTTVIQSRYKKPPTNSVDLDLVSPSLALPALEIEAAAAYAKAEKASGTRNAYRAAFGLFRSWCQARNVEPLPASAETVAAFLAFEADRGMAPATVDRRVASIRYKGASGSAGEGRCTICARGRW
jgi:hypothetical protein